MWGQINGKDLSFFPRYQCFQSFGILINVRGFAAILNRWGLDQVLAKFAILSDVVIARDPIAVCRTSSPYLSCLG